MASQINASNSGFGGVVTTGDSSGTLQLQAAGTTVATLTSSGVNAGIQVASFAAPAFSAYQSSGQSISSTTFTKITCGTKEWDTNSNYDNATNYRFTPTVAGYYQVNGVIGFTVSTRSNTVAAIYKNGVIYKTLNQLDSNLYIIGGSSVVYLNGSTDYIELYVYSGASGTTATGTYQTSFSATMIRSA